MHQDTSTRTQGSADPTMSRGEPPSMDGRAFKASICPKGCRIPLPDTCGCCSLQAGVVLTGLFTFVTSSGFVILLATRNIGQNAVNISEVRAALTYIIFIIYGLLIPSSLLVIVGNLKEKYWIYVPWLICNIVCILLPILLIIWVFAEDESEDRETHDLDIAIAVYHAINGILSLWGEVCVLSHYKKMYQRKYFVRRERARRSRGHYVDHFYPLPPPYTHQDPSRHESQTIGSQSDEQSGFNPDNLEGVRRRPPLPPYLMARSREFARSVGTTIRRAFRRNGDRGERSAGSPQGQEQVQGQSNNPQRQQRTGGQNRPTRQSQQAELDPTGNFMLGPHVTAVNVSQGNYGAVAGTSGVTVHREPLRNLSPSIPIPGVAESELSEDSSSAITNSTQEMVSTLTSLGSRELSRLSYWSHAKDSRDKHKKHRRSREASDNRQTDDNVVTMGVVNVGMDYDDQAIQHSHAHLHRGGRPSSPAHPHVHHRGPLPPTPDNNSPPQSRPISPQLHRNPVVSAPQLNLTDSNQSLGLPALYVGRAMRYADYFDGNRYQWGSHDFGLTDQNFRPPKPYVPPVQRPNQHHNRGPRMPLQVYQYGGYQSMDVFF